MASICRKSVGPYSSTTARTAQIAEDDRRHQRIACLRHAESGTPRQKTIRVQVIGFGPVTRNRHFCNLRFEPGKWHAGLGDSSPMPPPRLDTTNPGEPDPCFLLSMHLLMNPDHTPGRMPVFLLVDTGPVFDGHVHRKHRLFLN